MLTYGQLPNWEDMLLEAKPEPNSRVPLMFGFMFKPGHPKSEQYKKWFEDHDIKYTVFEQNLEGGIQDAFVDFTNQPDMAVLFKLVFG